MTTSVLSVRKGDERYELVEDGAVIGFADYQVRADAVVFPHTVINPDRRGEGLGAVLVQGALDDVRASDQKVVPICWYVGQFIDTHPEYADLLT